MFMQLKLVAILLFASVTVVTFIGHVLAGGVETQGDKCGPQEGLVRIGIAGVGESWFYEWSASGLKLTDKRNEGFSAVGVAPPGGVYAGEWDENAAGVPHDFLGADLRLDAPFAVSPDGQLLLTSVYPAEGELFLSSSPKIALIDRNSKRLAFSFDAPCNVKSLTWAPSGKYFAVLLSQNVTKEVWKGPLNWFASMVGHPISYYTLYATTYDLEGKVLCERRLNEKLRRSSGYLVWER
jgi:hypothetical protein